MLIIYTGNGKGKTSACVGQTIRAKGQNKSVVFAQFFKRPYQAGEQKLLEEILKDDFYANGPGFYLGDESKLEIQREAAQTLLSFVKAKISSSASPLFMLVLDEALYALSSNVILKEELEEIIDACKKNNVHLVLSGRGLTPWLQEAADFVSIIEDKKHPYASGQGAQEGIEY